MGSISGALRQPVFHFVVLGVLLFVIDAARSEDPAEGAAMAPIETEGAAADPHLIVIDSRLRDTLADAFRTDLDREPSEADIDALVEDWVQEEALRREALALGLDENDPIIRRRLVQNMRFVLESARLPAEATEAEIDAWIAEHLPAPAARARLDFTHVFIDATRNEDPQARATELTEALQAGGDPATLGDPFIRGRNFRNVGRSEVARLLGDDAAALVLTLEPGTWSAPIVSTFGLHLVRVSERREPPVQGSEPERETARRAIQRTGLEAAEQAAIDEVVARYQVERR